MFALRLSFALALLSLAAAHGSLRGGADLPVLPAVDSAISMVQVDAMAMQSTARNLGVRGDMTVNGVLSTSTLTSPVGDVKVSGNVEVSGSIKSASTLGSFLSARSSTSVTNGIQPKGSELQILGKIEADSIDAGAVSSSFLEIDGVRQWQLVSLSDFEEDTNAAEGWDHTDLTECAGNKFLGGPCTKAGSTEVKKTYTGLPPHSQLRVAAKYLFIDSWDGESAYMKINDHVQWAETYNHAQVEGKGINVCGNETPEGRYMRNLDVTVPHTTDDFTLTFGATTDEHSCDESFGVDSIMVFVR